MIPRQRAQTEGSEQLFFHNIDDRAPAFLFQDRMFERDREKLIGPAGIVVTICGVHDIVEVAAGLEPKALIE